MDIKHTPGPWEVKYDNADDRSGGQWYQVGPASVWFAYGSTDETVEQKKADSRLIAAAPEMYEALKKLLYAADHSTCDSIACDHARAVLAKVEK